MNSRSCGGAACCAPGELAEAWEIRGDGRSITFRMRHGPRFSSGQPVTAQDAAFPLQRAVRLNKCPAPIINQFGFTAGNVTELIRASDARTLTITMGAPASPALLLCCLTANVGSVVERAAAARGDRARADRPPGGAAARRAGQRARCGRAGRDAEPARRSARGLTFVLVSHNLAVVAHLCERAAMMQQGEIVETLDEAALRAGRAAHPHMQELIALSRDLEAG